MLKHCSTPCLVKSSSVSSSSESLSDYSPPISRSPIRQQTLVKVFTDRDTLANKMSYTTIMVDKWMTSRDIISRILHTKMKIKSADPDLYQLYMAIETEEGERSVRLEASSRLMDLISCTPWSSFRLVLTTGHTLKLRVWDNISQSLLFRSILVSRECTVSLAITILHQFYPHLSRGSLALYEECPQLGFKRPLAQHELPYKVMQCWGDKSQFRFSLEQQDYNSNKMSPFSREGFYVRTMNRKMLKFLKTFLENTQEVSKQTDEIIQGDSFCKVENDSVNSDSFLYVSF